MLKSCALALAIVALGACANAGSASGSSGIQGGVTIGPGCPVEIQGSPCPDRPFAARIVVHQGTHLVSTFETGADGRFHIALDPGTYDVSAFSLEPNGVTRMIPIPPVTVKAGAYTAVPISFDNGIR
jgi:hypothetical protein